MNQYLATQFQTFGPSDAPTINATISQSGYECEIGEEGIGTPEMTPTEWALTFNGLSGTEQDTVANLITGDGNGKRKVRKL